MNAPFATFQDYSVRYGADEADKARIDALLSDASALIESELPRGETPPEGVLTMVACAMVSRASSRDDAGISSYSEGAAGFSESVTYANPNGDLYLTAQERAALGIGVGRIGVCDPWAVAR